MNRVKATACKPNQMDYSFEKNSISQCEKKCLAFRGSLQDNVFSLLILITSAAIKGSMAKLISLSE